MRRYKRKSVEVGRVIVIGLYRSDDEAINNALIDMVNFVQNLEGCEENVG